MSTVYFRTFEENDSEIIYQWMNDDKLKELSVGLNRRMSHEECREWVNARIKHSPYSVWWAICGVKDNKLIGYASISQIHYINSSADFSGIVIGDKDYQDGFAWIETYLFILEYVFDRLNLHRLYGNCLKEHRATRAIHDALFFKEEGIMRDAIFKNGEYHDEIISSLLDYEYRLHRNAGEYKLQSIIKRLLKSRIKTN